MKISYLIVSLIIVLIIIYFIYNNVRERFFSSTNTIMVTDNVITIDQIKEYTDKPNCNECLDLYDKYPKGFRFY